MQLPRYIVGAMLCLMVPSCSVFDIKTSPPSSPHLPPLAVPKRGTERIVVFSHGWHTGVVIPTASLRRHPWARDLKMGQTSYAEFGWGAEEFYRKKGITPGMVLRGLFWPTAAVIHLERFPETPYQHYPTSTIATIELTKAEMDALISKLRRSFKTNADGSLIDLGPGVKKDSRFFRSQVKYYYPRTCNIWTSRLLNAAGLNIKESTRSPELMESLRRSRKRVR